MYKPESVSIVFLVFFGLINSHWLTGIVADVTRPKFWHRDVWDWGCLSIRRTLRTYLRSWEERSCQASCENGLAWRRGLGTVWDACVLAITSGKSDAFSLTKSPSDASSIKGADQEHFRVFLVFLVTCVLWIGTVRVGLERRTSSQKHKNGKKYGLTNSLWLAS